MSFSSSDMRRAIDLLVFLLHRMPHKHMHLFKLRNQLDAGSTSTRRNALTQLETLAKQYPEDYLVFQAEQRLLGK